MGKIRRGRTERENVRIINQEWVENNCTNVTLRDKEMLKLLARFPVMNSHHLYLLTPSTDGQLPFYELNQGQKRCNDRIRILYDKHCVNKASPRVPIGEGTSKQYVWLDRAGIKLLGLERRARYELPQDYKHQSMVLDVYCELVLLERNGVLENKYLQTETPTGELIPDATTVFKYTHANKGKAIFIEVDRSQKKEADEKSKLEQYKQWELSGGWTNEAWCKTLPRPIFPQVLYLFDETQPRWRQRAKRLEKKAKSIGLKSTFIGFSELNDYIMGNL